LLVAIVLASGTLSAFLVNDTFSVGAPLRVMTILIGLLLL
jgi:hypothetical protein